MNWQQLKAWSWVVPTLVAFILLGEKIAEAWPDSMTPATVEYVDEAVSPIDQLALDSAKKGISWSLSNRSDSQFPPTYVHEESCGNLARNTEGYYRTYERIAGAKHPTEGEYCE